MAKHSARGLSNSKEEMVEGIIFRTFYFSHFSLHFCLFLLFLTVNDLVMCVSVGNIDVSL